METRFRQLVDAHRHRVYQLACLLLGQAQEAEDVAQDTLLKLWTHLPVLRAGEERAWLMTCTRNACLDRLRGKTRSRRLLRLVGVPEPVITPDGAAQASERQHALMRAVRAQPEPGCSLLILRDIQGLDVATVARVLELSTNQVKVYTFRARRALRRQLEEEFDEQAA